MKFAPYLFVFGLLMFANARPEGNGKYSASKFFEGNLDSIQGAIEDMLLAGEDLEILEAKLEELVANKDTIFSAETLLEQAVNASAYSNLWTHTNV